MSQPLDCLSVLYNSISECCFGSSDCLMCHSDIRLKQNHSSNTTLLVLVRCSHWASCHLVSCSQGHRLITLLVRVKTMMSVSLHLRPLCLQQAVIRAEQIAPWVWCVWRLNDEVTHLITLILTYRYSLCDLSPCCLCFSAFVYSRQDKKSPRSSSSSPFSIFKPCYPICSFLSLLFSNFYSAPSLVCAAFYDHGLS